MLDGKEDNFTRRAYMTEKELAAELESSDEYKAGFRAGFEAKEPAAEISRLWNRIGVIEHKLDDEFAEKDGEIKFLKDLALGMAKRMDVLEQKMRSEGIVLRRHEAVINAE